MAKIIAIANQKGGVAKTTTTMNLGDALSSIGKRVLMIDADPQGSLSSNLGYDRQEYETKGKTLAHCFAGDTTIKDAVVGSRPKIIVSSDLLNVIEDELPKDFTLLAGMINDIRDHYDFILIDCGPGLSKVMRNALGSADFVLIPVKTDKSSTEGISLLIKTIRNLADRVNPKLQILGILPTMYKKRYKHDKDTLDMLQTKFGAVVPVFDPIPYSTWYDRAADSLKAVFSFRANAPGVKEYTSIAKHLTTIS